MKKDYKTLFNNLITSKIDELIIKYDSKKDNYTYQGFSHYVILHLWMNYLNW